MGLIDRPGTSPVNTDSYRKKEPEIISNTFNYNYAKGKALLCWSGSESCDRPATKRPLLHPHTLYRGQWQEDAASLHSEGAGKLQRDEESKEGRRDSGQSGRR